MLRQTMFLACLLALIGSAQAALDDYYHNYDEVLSELDSLETLYPEWMHTITIGYSHVGNRPIKAVRVSDNPQVDEGEPAIFIGGHIHAEEILGTEIVMQALEELTYHGSIMHPEWMPILTSLELWFVPCWNPDGLDVVLSETDVTYRKNTHSLAEDGHCHLEPGIGNDSCGVDLNRNWPFWWNHGDTLWSDNNDVEQFDYFRGPTPFSESESQAVRDLLLATRPVAGVQYHSARTSTNYEILIHAWDFGVGDDGIKTCPTLDYQMQQTLTRTMADQIETLDHNLYRNFAGGGRKGAQNMWMYAALGCVAMTAEVGGHASEGMQPQNWDRINFIVEENLEGLYWLFRRAVGYETNAPALYSRITDSNDQPLSARIALEEVMHADCVPYYMTRGATGMHHRLLQPAPYTIHVRKYGYAPLDTTVNVGPSLPTNRHWVLSELPVHNVSLTVHEGGSGTPLNWESVEIYSLEADTTLSFSADNNLALSLPAGTYRLQAMMGEYIDQHLEFSVFGNATLSLTSWPRMNAEEAAFDHIYSDLSEFNASGENCNWGNAWDDSLGNHFADTPVFWSEPNTNCRLAVNEPIQLSLPTRNTTAACLNFTAVWQMEAPYDSAYVEFSADGEVWETVRAFTGQQGLKIRPYSIPVPAEYYGGALYFAFRVKTDENEQDAGFHVKDIRFSWNSSAVDVAAPVTQPERIELLAVPNPFNPGTSLRYTLPSSQHVRLSVHDLLGREVAQLVNIELPAGEHEAWLDGQRFSSGLYIVRLHAGEQLTQTKVLLLK